MTSIWLKKLKKRFQPNALKDVKDKLKKTDYITKQNQTENANKMEEAIPLEIKEIFDMYSKKRL